MTAESPSILFMIALALWLAWFVVLVWPERSERR